MAKDKITIEGDKDKIKKLKKELRTRLKRNDLVLKETKVKKSKKA
jgi:hypothetical protein